jgi:DNA-binding transcriptional MerR regulator
VRLELILRSKRLGFSIVEIKELFDLYDSAQGDTKQVTRFLKVLSSKREHLGEMKKDIEAMLSEIDMFEYQCKRVQGKQGQIGK